MTWANQCRICFFLACWNALASRSRDRGHLVFNGCGGWQPCSRANRRSISRFAYCLSEHMGITAFQDERDGLTWRWRIHLHETKMAARERTTPMYG